MRTTPSRYAEDELLEVTYTGQENVRMLGMSK